MSGSGPSRRFEELGWASTPMGDISLRRRHDPVLAQHLLEVRLGEEFLMSSAFTVAERALATLSLNQLGTSIACDVVVGGLGLGYTAVAALADPRVRSLVVVEALPQVIGWHRDGLLPDAAPLRLDPRVRLLHGDFFALAAGETGFDPQAPGTTVDTVLLDIDHSPRHLLHPSHEAFYSRDGLLALARHLRPHAVFGLWSDDPPDAAWTDELRGVFLDVEAHVVEFDNPYTGTPSANTVYVASGVRDAAVQSRVAGVLPRQSGDSPASPKGVRP